MRLYLNTCILFPLFLKKNEELDRNTRDMLNDYSNQLHTSSICVAELMQLSLTRRQGRKKGRKEERHTVLQWLADRCITVEHTTDKHLLALQKLPLFPDHRDTADRIIIAQAISDRATLVSSDLKFARYCEHGLSLHYNKHSVEQE